MSTKKTLKELVYAEFDEEFGIFGVFGQDTGFCYAQPATKEKANQLATEWNEHGGRVKPK